MRRPNILFIHTDQQRHDALGVNGNADIHTPNLDALAGEGVNFDHYFVQAAVCMPSRMSYLTGLYPSKLGVTMNGPALPADAVTLPAMLSGYGYYCGNIGKLHFLPHAGRDHRQVHPSYGFDHLEVADEPGTYEDAYRAWVRRKAPDQLDAISVGLPPVAVAWRKMMGITETIRHPDRVETRPLAFPGSSDVTHSAFVADQTIEFLRARRDQAFLCVAGFFSPHAPLVTPQEFLDLYDPPSLKLPEFPPELDRSAAGQQFSDDGLRLARQGYYGLISEVDHHVGRILACLGELGLAENTIVVFTSDHGEYLGEHLKYGKGYPAEDCVSRVPLIVRYAAGGAGGGRTCSDIVEAVDLLPSLLRWAGLQCPPHLQGRPMPLADSEAEPRSSALTEGHGWKTLRTARYRYVLRADGDELLFDMSKPLAEYRNVAGHSEYGQLLADARKDLACRLIERERMLPAAVRY